MVRPRQFDEAAVIGEALDVFWANGYAGTSVDAIGAATGLGKGSLYGAFGGKRQIFGRVFERYCIDALGAASQALDGPDEGAATGSDPERGCFLAKSVAELGKRDTEVQARARETYTALEDHLTATIGAAQRYGSLDPNGDARTLAQALLALQRGIEALGKAGRTDVGPGVADLVLAPFAPSAG